MHGNHPIIAFTPLSACRMLRLSKFSRQIVCNPIQHKRFSYPKCGYCSISPSAWVNNQPLEAVTTVPQENLSETSCRLYNICDKPIPYQKAWEWQHMLFDAMRKDLSLPDAIIMLEHEPVYTLGSSSKLENVLFDAEQLKRGQTRSKGSTNQPMLVRTERGGEVTYHGPGQLVAYPILNLCRHKKDLHWYLRSLEETVIFMLKKNYGIDAGRKEGLTGVWVGNTKICAMGLKISKWITMHGLALNVTANLDPFNRIIPCGISDHGVSSLHLLTDKEVSMEKAREQLMDAFSEIFGPYSVVEGKLQ